MIARSKDVVALLQDLFNHTEEEDGNVKILKMIYLFLQNLYVGQGGIEKLIDDGQLVLPKGPQELKTAVAKGLTIMIHKLENKTREGT